MVGLLPVSSTGSPLSDGLDKLQTAIRGGGVDVWATGGEGESCPVESFAKEVLREGDRS